MPPYVRMQAAEANEASLITRPSGGREDPALRSVAELKDHRIVGRSASCLIDRATGYVYEQPIGENQHLICVCVSSVDVSAWYMLQSNVIVWHVFILLCPK